MGVHRLTAGDRGVYRAVVLVTSSGFRWLDRPAAVGGGLSLRVHRRRGAAWRQAGWLLFITALVACWTWIIGTLLGIGHV